MEKSPKILKTAYNLWTSLWDGEMIKEGEIFPALWTMNIRASSVSKSIPKGMMHVCGTHLHYSLFYWSLGKNTIGTGFNDWNYLGKGVIFFYCISKPLTKEDITDNPLFLLLFLPQLFLCALNKQQHLLEKLFFFSPSTQRWWKRFYAVKSFYA